MSQFQVGFQAKANCEINILKLILEAKAAYKKWTNSSLRGRPYIVFFDLKSAFDSCDHNILFRSKLNQFRVPTPLVNAIKLLYQNFKTTPTLDYKHGISI